MAHICAVAHYKNEGIIDGNLIMEKLFQTVRLVGVISGGLLFSERMRMSSGSIKAKLR